MMSDKKLSATDIVRFAKEGDLTKVKEIASKYRTQIDMEVQGETALRVAVANGNCDMIDFLVSKYADKNMRDINGDSYLHTAIKTTQTRSLEKLLSLKVKTDVRNNAGLTALELALKEEYMEGVKALQRRMNTKIRQPGIRNGHVACNFVEDMSLSTKMCQNCSPDNEIAMVELLPCSHMIVCIKCSITIDECKHCRKTISQRTLNKKYTEDFLHHYKEMENKIKECELKCPICMEATIDGVVVPCGHGICSNCVQQCKECPQCKTEFTDHQKIFLT